MRLVVVSLCVLALAAVAVGQATHTDYTLESVTYLMDSPEPYLTHMADGWLLVRGLPVGANYTNSLGDSGILRLAASGKISTDFSTGNFHGTVTLDIDGGKSCAGRLRAKRGGGVEEGSWVLHCSDGSKMRERWQFDVPPPDAASWLTTGTGTLLEP